MSFAPAGSGYRADIDGLRGIAVLTVVGFHTFPQFVPGGFVGVDIFFVISGFLISGILLKSLEAGTFSFLDFYSRRIKRIFPALAVVLLTTWAIGWFVLLADEYQNLGKHIAGGSAFISNFILWNESGYFDTEAQLKPLLHLWSLGVEEQFYILWPILLLISWKRRLNILVVIVIFGFVSFSFNAVQIVTSPITAFYLPMSRMWELMLGALLAFGESNGQRWRPAFRPWIQRYNPNIEAVLLNFTAACGIALIVVSVAYLDKSMKYPGWWALMPTLGAFLLMAVGNDAWINRNILANRLLVFVGLISYPLYLWHWPLLSFAENIYAQNPPREIKIAAVALAMVLAWLTYEFFEKPIRHGRFSKLRRSVPIALIVSTVCVGALGVATYLMDGFLNRFPQVWQNLTNYKFDYNREYRTGRCLLGAGQTEKSFTADCVDPPESPGQPLIFLWGDSHAGALYPGFKSIQKSEGFSLGQLTTNSCPPYIDYDAPNRAPCRPINDFVLRKILNLKPKIVFLHGSWGFYGEAASREKFPETVKLLKDAGIEIVLIGPVPIWNPSLPKAIFEAYKSEWPHRIPARMNNIATETVRQTDRFMRDIAANNAITYFSAFDAFCNAGGCSTFVGGEPVAWDSSHLTGVGADYLVQGMFEKLQLQLRPLK